MFQMFGGQDGRVPERVVLSTAKQPMKPVVTVVRSEDSLSAITVERSDGLLSPCSGVGEPGEDRSHTTGTVGQLLKPPATGYWEDEGEEEEEDEDEEDEGDEDHESDDEITLRRFSLAV